MVARFWFAQSNEDLVGVLPSFWFSGFVWSKKLNHLKEKLTIWNKETFGRVDRISESLLADIKGLDQQDDDRVITSSQLSMRSQLNLKYETVQDKLHALLLQKSRVQWYKDGDRNSKMFHRIAKHRRRRNRVTRLKINNTWEDDRSMIKGHIVSHFHCRFKSSSDPCFSLAGMNFKRISEEEGLGIQRSIDVEEVFLALQDLNQSRAPGPDGFHVSVILKCWKFMKNDIMRVVKDFEDHGSVDWRLKYTFVSLIPKTETAEEVKNLRPISLSNTIFKLISKVLANRLKELLPKLISNHQSAF